MSKSILPKRDSSIGITLASGMVIFTLLGYAVDRKINSSPWGLLTGIFLGLAYGGYEIWKLLRETKDL